MIPSSPLAGSSGETGSDLEEEEIRSRTVAGVGRGAGKGRGQGAAHGARGSGNAVGSASEVAPGEEVVHMADEHDGVHVELESVEEVEERRTNLMHKLLTRKINTGKQAYEHHMDLSDFLKVPHLPEKTAEELVRKEVKAQKVKVRAAAAEAKLAAKMAAAAEAAKSGTSGAAPAVSVAKTPGKGREKSGGNGGARRAVVTGAATSKTDGGLTPGTAGEGAVSEAAGRNTAGAAGVGGGVLPKDGGVGGSRSGGPVGGPGVNGVDPSKVGAGSSSSQVGSSGSSSSSSPRGDDHRNVAGKSAQLVQTQLGFLVPDKVAGSQNGAGSHTPFKRGVTQISASPTKVDSSEERAGPGRVGSAKRGRLDDGSEGSGGSRHGHTAGTGMDDEDNGSNLAEGIAKKLSFVEVDVVDRAGVGPETPVTEAAVVVASVSSVGGEAGAL